MTLAFIFAEVWWEKKQAELVEKNVSPWFACPSFFFREGEDVINDRKTQSCSFPRSRKEHLSEPLHHFSRAKRQRTSQGRHGHPKTAGRPFASKVAKRRSDAWGASSSRGVSSFYGARTRLRSYEERRAKLCCTRRFLVISSVRRQKTNLQISENSM